MKSAFFRSEHLSILRTLTEEYTPQAIIDGLCCVYGERLDNAEANGRSNQASDYQAYIDELMMLNLDEA